MSRNNHNLRSVATTASIAVGLGTGLLAAGDASAVPILGVYVEDPRCDILPNQTLTHELGDQLIFPLNEGIIYSAQPTNTVICVPQDGNPNDWIVRILNTSGIAWTDLFFVADIGVTIGNSDGQIADAGGAPNVFTDAFRIDGTVTPGMNANLISESQVADEIFAPGEIWDFYVSNYTIGAGGFLPPAFTSPGLFSGTGMIPGNASILANPVPEPSALALAAIGVALPMRRRRRS